MARKNNITDEDLFDVPELDGDDQHEDDDGHEGPPLDAEEVDPSAVEEREERAMPTEPDYELDPDMGLDPDAVDHEGPEGGDSE